MQTQKATDDEEANDFVEHLFTAQAHDYLMFFTNTGRVYVERVYEVPEGTRTSKGRSSTVQTTSSYVPTEPSISPTRGLDACRASASNVRANWAGRVCSR